MSHEQFAGVVSAKAHTNWWWHSGVDECLLLIKPFGQRQAEYTYLSCLLLCRIVAKKSCHAFTGNQADTYPRCKSSLSVCAFVCLLAYTCVCVCVCLGVYLFISEIEPNVGARKI